MENLNIPIGKNSRRSNLLEEAENTLVRVFEVLHKLVQDGFETKYHIDLEKF